MAGDCLPLNICSRCHETISVFNEFKAACLNSQTILQNQIGFIHAEEDEIAYSNLNLENFLCAQDVSMLSNQCTSANTINKKNIDDTTNFNERTLKTEHDYYDDVQDSEAEELELENSNQTSDGSSINTGNRKNLPKLIPCDVCGKLLRKGQKMNEHINIHNGKDSFNFLQKASNLKCINVLCNRC